MLFPLGEAELGLLDVNICQKKSHIQKTIAFASSTHVFLFCVDVTLQEPAPAPAPNQLQQREPAPSDSSTDTLSRKRAQPAQFLLKKEHVRTP